MPALTPVTARELVRAWSDAQHGGMGGNAVPSPWNVHKYVILLMEIATGQMQYAILTTYTHLHIIGSRENFIDLRCPDDVRRINRYALPYPVPRDRNGRVALSTPGHTRP